MKTEQIAKVAHEINKVYCEAIGDTTQVDWDSAPDWQRQSAINGVNFHIANPTAGPDSSHNEWLKEKFSTGWKYGVIKDSAKKEHPCCVPYEALPIEQRVKDYLFRAIVHSLKDIN